MLNQTSIQNRNPKELKLVIKTVIEILVPVLLCLFAFNYIFMNAVKALSISEQTVNIIRIDQIVFAVSFVLVSMAVYNMARKAIKPVIGPASYSDGEGYIGGSLPPASSTVQTIRSNSWDPAHSFTVQPTEANKISVKTSVICSGLKSSSGHASGKRVLTVKISEDNATRRVEMLDNHLKDIKMLSLHIEDAIIEIKNIAHQANILALDAAIEAVHAGVNSNGFGIAADEIKRLVEISSKAAEEFNDLFSGSLNKAVYALETGRDMEQIITKTGISSCLSADLISENDADRASQGEALSKIELDLQYIPK